MMSPADDDVRPSDVALAVIVAMLTLTVMYVVLEVARLQQRSTPPVVDTRIPIRVKPVLDVPPPALAGAPAPASPEPPPEPPPPEPPPPEPPPPELTTPSDKPPPPPRKIKPETTKPPEPTKPPETPPPATPPTPEPGPPAEPSEPVSEGEGEGPPSRGRDPLGDKAIAAYRERLIRWLSARFEVRGSGLTRAQLETFRAKVQIDISEDARVVGYTIVSADHPAFDAAARAALDAVKGEPVPPPPEFYPGALQRRIKVTFVCTESTCD